MDDNHTRSAAYRTTRAADGSTLLTLHGELDLRAVPALSAALDALTDVLADGRPHGPWPPPGESPRGGVRSGAGRPSPQVGSAASIVQPADGRPVGRTVRPGGVRTAPRTG
ncbi:hypothetical protein ACKI1K_42755 [Streptomyces scabiei]|uniref:hypothetical protein n=1 Tax=Streptomyces scabiei TaxID=1930 RepID=UPI00068D31D3|nr:hypothetical protein [Streptomyces sp. LBUM 1485]